MSDNYYGNDENDWNDECEFFNEDVILNKRREEEKGKVIDLDQYLESSEPLQEIYDDDGDIDWLLPTRFVSNEQVPESTSQQDELEHSDESWKQQENVVQQCPDRNSYFGDCYQAPNRDFHDVSPWEEERNDISSPTRFVSKEPESRAQKEVFEQSRKQQEYVVQQCPVGCMNNFTQQYPDGNSYFGDCYPAPICDVQCVPVDFAPRQLFSKVLDSEHCNFALSRDSQIQSLPHPMAPTPRQPFAPLKQARFILVHPTKPKRQIRKPRSPYTIPSRTTLRKARLNLPPVTESTVEVTIWKNETPNLKRESIARPPLSYQTLANLACLNSPSKSVSLQEVYSFVFPARDTITIRHSLVMLVRLSLRRVTLRLVSARFRRVCKYAYYRHHFPYYRFIEQNSWKGTLRKILCRRELFVRVFDSSNEVLYEIINKNVDDVGYTDWEMEWINQDGRGVDFFRKMQRGQVGLPRQLFYSVIGIGCPQFAGPENSALFYHLWSIGHRFDNITNLFRSHNTEFTGEEPVFDEERFFLHLTKIRRLHVDKKWGYGVNMEDGVNWSEKDSALFFKKIGWYFNEQNEMKRRDLPNWATPSLVRENIQRDQNVDL